MYDVSQHSHAQTLYMIRIDFVRSALYGLPHTRQAHKPESLGGCMTQEVKQLEAELAHLRAEVARYETIIAKHNGTQPPSRSSWAALVDRALATPDDQWVQHEGPVFPRQCDALRYQLKAACGDSKGIRTARAVDGKVNVWVRGRAVAGVAFVSVDAA